MKTKILLLIVILLISCKQPVTTEISTAQTVTIVKDSTKIVKIVKDLKEEVDQNTDYHYKYDWLNGKFRQQPRVYTTNKYYCIYTDGSYEKITKDRYFFLTKGDTVTSYQYN